MNTLVWLVPSASLLLGAVLRSRRVRRRLRALSRECAEKTAELSRMDHDAHRKRLIIRGVRLQNGSMRRRLRAVEAERDDAYMEAARTLRRVWRAAAERDALAARVELLELDSLGRELRAMEAGP